MMAAPAGIIGECAKRSKEATQLFWPLLASGPNQIRQCVREVILFRMVPQLSLDCTCTMPWSDCLDLFRLLYTPTKRVSRRSCNAKNSKRFPLRALKYDGTVSQQKHSVFLRFLLNLSHS